MPRKINDIDRIITYFMTAPIEEAKNSLSIAGTVLNSRIPKTVAEPATKKARKKRANTKAPIDGTPATTHGEPLPF